MAFEVQKMKSKPSKTFKILAILSFVAAGLFLILSFVEIGKLINNIEANKGGSAYANNGTVIINDSGNGLLIALSVLFVLMVVMAVLIGVTLLTLGLEANEYGVSVKMFGLVAKKINYADIQSVSVSDGKSIHLELASGRPSTVYCSNPQEIADYIKPKIATPESK